VVLGILFVAAFCLRVYIITQLPIAFDQLREYHGALLARGFYEWWLSGHFNTIPPDGIIEPPILEILSSLAYLILGGEHLWIPQLLSALFWMVGGVFLYLVAKRIVSPNAAVFCVFFYLFLPYGVLASRAFMPDPLMIMLLLMSIYTIVSYYERPTGRRLLAATVASALVIFVKPGICVFQVFGVFVSLGVYRQGVRRLLVNPRSLIFAALSVLPTGLYYVYGTFLAGFLRGEASQKVVPRLLLEAPFWEGWFGNVRYVVGLAAIVGTLLGLLLLRKGLPRALMIGLWGGYILFGLTFDSHVATHDYYSLQLIPVVALSLGPLADLVLKYLHQTVRDPGPLGWRGYGRVTVLALSTAVLVLSVAGSRQAFAHLTGSMRAQQERAASYIATFQKIGEVVNHSRRTLVLFGGSPSGGPNYGFALMYYGHFSGETWPYPTHKWESQQGKRAVTTEELFSRRYRKHTSEYFIISRGWWNQEELMGLRTFLSENFPMVAQGDNYVVFDLRKGPDTKEHKKKNRAESNQQAAHH
jgi:4-amino-4-deoxy-L-arabinose transferase-like glycosyltransferase